MLKEIFRRATARDIIEAALGAVAIFAITYVGLVVLP
jgi:hypothetical protein